MGSIRPKLHRLLGTGPMSGKQRVQGVRVVSSRVRMFIGTVLSSFVIRVVLRLGKCMFFVVEFRWPRLGRGILALCVHS